MMRKIVSVLLVMTGVILIVWILGYALQGKALPPPKTDTPKTVEKPKPDDELRDIGVITRKGPADPSHRTLEDGGPSYDEEEIKIEGTTAKELTLRRDAWSPLVVFDTAYDWEVAMDPNGAEGAVLVTRFTDGAQTVLRYGDHTIVTNFHVPKIWLLLKNSKNETCRVILSQTPAHKGEMKFTRETE